MTPEKPLKVSFRHGALRPKSVLPSPSSSPSRGAKRPASSAAVPIPLPSSHITRTESELQLREDTAAAEWADQAMFHRLVNGMRDRNQRQLQEQQRRQDDELLRRLQHQRQRSGLFPPAAPAPCRDTRRDTEGFVTSVFSTRQVRPREEQGQDHQDHARRIVSPETTATTAAERDHQHHDRLEALHSTLFQASNEDWSFEGFDDKSTREENATATNEDDATYDGIFSLDL